jgi:hypothetical protein
MTTRQISYRLKADGKAELKRDAAEAGAALEEAGDRGAAGFERTNRVLKATGELSDGQVAKYKKLALAAAEAQRAEEAQARINGVLGVGTGPRLRPSDFLTGEELGGPAGLTRGQRAGRLNLARQGADIFTTGAMGMSPTMIAIQQGPQIIDALAQAGIKATPAIIALGGSVAGVAAAVIAAGVAQNQYERSVRDVETATRGLGAAAGMTAEGVLAQAEAAAQAGDITLKSAREFSSQYVATGKIGQGVLQDLVAMTKDYAATTRQDAAGATKELAAAFSDPAKGAKDLNDKLHFLRTAELEHIENLAQAGREAEAQAILVDKLKGSLLDASDATSSWGRVADTLALKWDRVWDSVGRAIDRMVTGGSSADKVAAARQTIADADRALASEPEWARNIPGSAAADWVKRRREAQALIDQEYRKYVADMDRQRDAALSTRDSDRQELVDRYNPDAGRLRKAKADRDNLVRVGTPDEASKKALRDLNADIRAMEAGYKSAADQAAAVGRQNRQNAKENRQAAAEARREQRERDEAIRLEGLRADHALDNQRRLAQARGDDSALDVLTRQGRLQDEINRYLREGFSITQATANARAQVRDEMEAESDRLRKERSNPEGFVSSADSIAAALKGGSIEQASWLSIYGDRLRLRTRDAFEDGLLAGMDGGNFFEVFADRLKYAAASALASSLTKELFGSREGSGTVGLIQKALKFLPKFAAGTDFAPGGLSLVGEYGPEIVNLPRGSGVRSALDTHAMIQNAAVRAANTPALPPVQITYAPSFDARGAGPREVEELRAQMAADRASFEARVTQAVQDGLNRRKIRV